MAVWEYGELIAESISASDEGDWVTRTVLTWHGPVPGGRAVTGTTVSGLNRLGADGWELVGVTRNQIVERFQIKAVMTYVLKRPVRRRMRRGDTREAQAAAAAPE